MAPKNKSSRQSKKKRQKRVQQHVEDESDSEQGGFTGAIWDAVADGSGIIFDLVNWTIVYPIRRTTSFVADIAIATHYAAVGGLTSVRFRSAAMPFGLNRTIELTIISHFQSVFQFLQERFVWCRCSASEHFSAASRRSRHVR